MKKFSVIEKYEARGAAAAAINRGEIVKTPCEICKSHTVDAHHDDYSKPLQVRFLCRSHHLGLHRGWDLRKSNEVNPNFNIDFKATQKLFEEMGLIQTKVARRITTKKLTITPSLFNQVMRGTYKFMESERAQRVIDELRNRKVLVERP